MNKKLKQARDVILGILLFVLFIAFFCLGIWFLTGGDLRELMNGCYNANGCN